MSLDAASYPLLWAFADQTGVRPEWILPVLHHESGFNPSLPNSQGAPYYGLNQVSGDYLTSRGIAIADYLTWPASQQLQEVVLPFLRSYGSSRSATRLYQGNFLPATLSTATSLSDVVTAAPSPFYEDNKSLDVNGDGAITVGDLAAVMAKEAATPAVQNAIAAAYALRPSESPQDPVYGTDFLHPTSKAVLIAFGIVAASATVAYTIHAGYLDKAIDAIEAKLPRRRRLAR